MKSRNGFTVINLIKRVGSALIVLALIFSLAFCLQGCGKDKSSKDNKPASNNSSDSNSSDKNSTGDKAKQSFTVTFKDYDGTVLSTEKVEKGKGAKAPEEPKRENFKFAGWDKAFDKVTSDLVVTATYTTTKTVIYAENVSVNKGTNEVKVKIRVLNNPAIMGAVLKLSVDDKVFSFKEATKTEFPSLTLTSSGPKTTASPYSFVLDALKLSDDDKKDGTLFEVTLKVKDAAATGKYDIKLSYDSGTIFDENYKDPKVCLENGSITIK